MPDRVLTSSQKTLLKVQLWHQLRDEFLQVQATDLQDVLQPLCSAMPSIRRTQRPRKQGVALLTVTNSDSLGEFILLVPRSIGSVSLHILVAGGEMLQPRDIIRIFTNLQLQRPHGHLDKKKKMSTLVGAIDPIHHKKINSMG